MDFESLIADLRSAAEIFKQFGADKCLATASFCQRACKAIDKTVREGDTFENLVIGIWVIVGYINELLPQFVNGTPLMQLSNDLFRQCARIVLDIQWQQLDEDSPSRQNFQASLSSCHDQMAPRGYTRFGLLQGLMDKPWTEPTLTLVMGSEEDSEKGEGLAYIQAQDPEILKLRVELMMQENCDEFALNLCSWCLKHPALLQDLDVRRTQFTLLHRAGNVDKLQEECLAVELEDSIKLIISLQEKEELKELCTVLAQTFLVQNWIKPSDSDSKRKLLRLWIRQQYQADPDKERFISSLWAVAKLSHSTEQLLLVIDAVREQCGDSFIQFYTDLCIFAINVDKGYLDKLVKESGVSGPGDEAAASKRDMAKVCDKLVHIVAHVSPKVSFCCALTAFALQPSQESLQAVCDAYQRKIDISSSSKSKCCSNCAADQGQCLKHAETDISSREVNIATLYEVERLCGMLRPAYLSPDNDFPNLYAMCKQYLRKETGEAAKLGLPALMRSQKIKSSPSVQQVPPSTTQSSSLPSQPSKPNILRTPSLTGKPSQVNAAGESFPPVQIVTTAPKLMHTQQRLPAEQSASIPVLNMTPLSAQTLLGAQHKSQQMEIPQTTSTSLFSSAQQQRACTAAHSSVQSLSQVPNAALMQQLVLKQLSADVVQALLHLVQSGKLSSAQLNQMISNPSFSAQIVRSLHPTPRSQSLSSQDEGQKSQQLQQQAQKVQVQHQQPQPLKQQLQQMQIQLEQQQGKSVQSHFPQQSFTRPISAQSSHVIPVRTPLGQVTSQPVPAVGACHGMHPRIIRGQLILQQSPSLQMQTMVKPTTPQHHLIRGVQPLRPSMSTNPSPVSAIRVTSTREIQRTAQQLQVMAFHSSVSRQSQGAQPTVTMVSSPQMLLQTGHVLNHLSGGSVTTVSKPHNVHQQIYHLQTQDTGIRVAQMRPTVSIVPRMKIVSSSQNVGNLNNPTLSACTPSTRTVTPGGNRHYLINNLLFTGETKNSNLSIALPDTLPEISVDSVSDTLRALGDPTSEGDSILKLSSSRVSASSTVLQSQNLHTTAQTLPSIATLFGPNRQLAPSQAAPSQLAPNQSPISNTSTESPSSTIGTGSSSATPTITSSIKTCALGQRKGQKKSGNCEKAAKGSKDVGGKPPLMSKEDLTKLLKEAMTLNMEKKQLSAEISSTTAYHSYLHLPNTSVPSRKVNTPSCFSITPVESLLQSSAAKSNSQTQVQNSVQIQKESNPHGHMLRVSESVQPMRHFQIGESQRHVQSIEHQTLLKASEPQRHQQPGEPLKHLHTSEPHSYLQTGEHQRHVQTNEPQRHLQTIGTSQDITSEPNRQPFLSTHLGIFHAAPSVNKVPFISQSNSAIKNGNNPIYQHSSSTTPATANPAPRGGLLPSYSIVSSAGGILQSHASVNSVVGVTPDNRSSPKLHSLLVEVAGAGVGFRQPEHPTCSQNADTHLLGTLSNSLPSAPPASIPSTSSHLVTPDSITLPLFSNANSANPIKTYSKQDTLLSTQPTPPQDSQSTPYIENCFPSENLPATETLPEGSVVVDIKGGEMSIATYRCIICAKAFMTLDALRLHVKQICRPGLNQPGLGDRAILNKVQATEPGLETSTVFQCMRCFELCISESGIREHKLVCSKAPLAKSKHRSRAKPKSPKVLSEEEQATEAKVRELLNKCLGENREKLISSDSNISKKRTISESDGLATENADAKRKKKSNRKKLPENQNYVIGQNSLDGLNQFSEEAESKEINKSVKKIKKENISVVVPEYSALPEQSEMITIPILQNQERDSCVPTPLQDGDKTSAEAKSKPKRKYYPKKKKSPQIAAEDNIVENKDEYERKTESTTENSSPEQTVKKKMKKKEKIPSLPTPKFKELSGSGGRSFFKCLNCGQTLCSIENFMEHWLECIVKKPPPPPKPKRASKENKPVQPKTEEKTNKTDKSKIASNLPSISSHEYDSGIIKDNSDFTVDESQKFDFTNENIHNPVIVSSDSVSEIANRTEAIRKTTENGCDLSVPKMDFVFSNENDFRRGIPNDSFTMEEAPASFQADGSEIINEMQVETSYDVGEKVSKVKDVFMDESIPHLKDSFVVLEKVLVPQELVEAYCKQKLKNKEHEKGARSSMKPVTKTLDTPLSKSAVRLTVDKLKTSQSGHSQKESKPSSQLHDRRLLKCGLPWFIGESIRARLNGTRGRSARILHKRTTKLTPFQGSAETFCSLCRKHFNKKQILIQHVAGKHVHPYTVRKLGDTSSYFCHLCQRVFSQFTHYMAHVPNHAQIILKKLHDMTSFNRIGFPGRSCRIACQRGVTRKSLRKHGRTSPKGLECVENGDTSGTKRSRGRPRKFSTTFDFSKPDSNRPKINFDTKCSVRTRHKQALNKLYVGLPLDCVEMSDAYQENKKCKSSDEENTSASILRDSTDKSSEFDDENDKNIENEEKNVAWKSNTKLEDEDVSQDMSLITVGEGSSSITKRQFMLHTKQDKEEELVTQGRQDLNLHPSSSHRLPTLFPRKPSFLESYLSYISSRSPEAPLPINRVRKRYASTGNRDEVRPVTSNVRRSSQENPPMRSSSPRTTGAKSPIHNLISAMKGKMDTEKMILNDVYYVGRFEKQLILPCIVNLGSRMDQVEIEKLNKEGLLSVNTKSADTLSILGECKPSSLLDKVQETSVDIQTAPEKTSLDLQMVDSSCLIPSDLYFPNKVSTNIENIEGLPKVSESKIESMLSVIPTKSSDLNLLSMCMGMQTDVTLNKSCDLTSSVEMQVRSITPRESSDLTLSQQPVEMQVTNVNPKQSEDLNLSAHYAEMQMNENILISLDNQELSSTHKEINCIPDEKCSTSRIVQSCLDPSGESCIKGALSFISSPNVTDVFSSRQTDSTCSVDPSLPLPIIRSRSSASNYSNAESCIPKIDLFDSQFMAKKILCNLDTLTSTQAHGSSIATHRNTSDSENSPDREFLSREISSPVLQGADSEIPHFLSNNTTTSSSIPEQKLPPVLQVRVVEDDVPTSAASLITATKCEHTVSADKNGDDIVLSKLQAEKYAEFQQENAKMFVTNFTPSLKNISKEIKPFGTKIIAQTVDVHGEDLETDIVQDHLETILSEKKTSVTTSKMCQTVIENPSELLSEQRRLIFSSDTSQIVISPVKSQFIIDPSGMHSVEEGNFLQTIQHDPMPEIKQNLQIPVTCVQNMQLLDSHFSKQDVEKLEVKDVNARNFQPKHEDQDSLHTLDVNYQQPKCEDLDRTNYQEQKSEDLDNVIQQQQTSNDLESANYQQQNSEKLDNVNYQQQNSVKLDSVNYQQKCVDLDNVSLNVQVDDSQPSQKDLGVCQFSDKDLVNPEASDFSLASGCCQDFSQPREKFPVDLLSTDVTGDDTHSDHKVQDEVINKMTLQIELSPGTLNKLEPESSINDSSIYFADSHSDASKNGMEIAETSKCLSSHNSELLDQNEQREISDSKNLIESTDVIEMLPQTHFVEPNCNSLSVKLPSTYDYFMQESAFNTNLVNDTGISSALNISLAGKANISVSSRADNFNSSLETSITSQADNSSLSLDTSVTCKGDMSQSQDNLEVTSNSIFQHQVPKEHTDIILQDSFDQNVHTENVQLEIENKQGCLHLCVPELQMVSDESDGVNLEALTDKIPDRDPDGIPNAISNSIQKLTENEVVKFSSETEFLPQTENSQSVLQKFINFAENMTDEQESLLEKVEEGNLLSSSTLNVNSVSSKHHLQEKNVFSSSQLIEPPVGKDNSFYENDHKIHALIKRNYTDPFHNHHAKDEMQEDLSSSPNLIQQFEDKMKQDLENASNSSCLIEDEIMENHIDFPIPECQSEGEMRKDHNDSPVPKGNVKKDHNISVPECLSKDDMREYLSSSPFPNKQVEGEIKEDCSGSPNLNCLIEAEMNKDSSSPRFPNKQFEGKIKEDCSGSPNLNGLIEAEMNKDSSSSPNPKFQPEDQIYLSDSSLPVQKRFETSVLIAKINTHDEVIEDSVKLHDEINKITEESNDFNNDEEENESCRVPGSEGMLKQEASSLSEPGHHESVMEFLRKSAFLVFQGPDGSKINENNISACKPIETSGLEHAEKQCLDDKSEDPPEKETLEDYMETSEDMVNIVCIPEGPPIPDFVNDNIESTRVCMSSQNYDRDVPSCLSEAYKTKEVTRKGSVQDSLNETHSFALTANLYTKINNVERELNAHSCDRVKTDADILSMSPYIMSSTRSLLYNMNDEIEPSDSCVVKYTKDSHSATNSLKKISEPEKSLNKSPDSSHNFKVCDIITRDLEEKCETSSIDHLPDLFIITEPTQPISDMVDSVSESFVKHTDFHPTIGMPSDEDTVVSAIRDDIEVKIVMLKSRGKQKQKKSDNAHTYYANKAVVQTVTEIPEKSQMGGDDCGSEADSGIRKPLQGVASLRKHLQPEPFVWEIDDIEDPCKQARNERKHRAFRQQVSIAPFTWDVDDNDQSISHQSSSSRSSTTRSQSKKNHHVFLDGEEGKQGSRKRKKTVVNIPEETKDADSCKSVAEVKTSAEIHLSKLTSTVEEKVTDPVVKKGIFSDETESHSFERQEIKKDRKEMTSPQSDTSDEVVLLNLVYTGANEKSLQQDGNGDKHGKSLDENGSKNINSVLPDGNGSNNEKSLHLDDNDVKNGQSLLCDDNGTKNAMVPSSLLFETPIIRSSRTKRRPLISGEMHLKCRSSSCEIISKMKLNVGETRSNCRSLSGGTVQSEMRQSNSGETRSKSRSSSNESSPRIRSSRGETLLKCRSSNNETHLRSRSSSGEMQLKNRSSNNESQLKCQLANVATLQKNRLSSNESHLRNRSSSGETQIKNKPSSSENQLKRPLTGETRLKSRSSKSETQSKYRTSRAGNSLSKNRYSSRENLSKNKYSKSYIGNTHSKSVPLRQEIQTESMQQKICKNPLKITDLEKQTDKRWMRKRKLSGQVDEVSTPMSTDIDLNITSQPSRESMQIKSSQDSSPSSVSPKTLRHKDKESMSDIDKQSCNLGSPSSQNTALRNTIMSLRSGLMRNTSKSIKIADSPTKREEQDLSKLLPMKDEKSDVHMEHKCVPTQVVVCPLKQSPITSAIATTSPQQRGLRKSQSSASNIQLPAMVRRRANVSSVTGSSNRKKLCIMPSQVTHLEVIRVTPIISTRRTRSLDRDCDQPNRTVHTRMSAEEYQASSVSQGKSVAKKGVSDHKWLINRVAPTARRGGPFTFRRAQNKSQTK